MDEVDELRKEITALKISLTGKQAELDEEKKEREEDEKRYKKKLETRFPIPKTTRQETEIKLKMCDDYTKNVIIKYLELDNIELTRNISGTVTNGNASDSINYMDGSIHRNLELIKLLDGSIDKRKEFYDKIEGESKKKKVK